MKIMKIFWLCGKKYDAKSVAIGGLLHDFYYKPWQNNNEKKKFLKKHGFVHAKEALDNSKIVDNYSYNSSNGIKNNGEFIIENNTNRPLFLLVSPQYWTFIILCFFYQSEYP